MELAATTLSAIAQDKQATIEAWVHEHGDSILKLAFSYMKDRHLAEDVFQEVFTRAYLNLDGFRGASQPRTWLCSITINLCRDRLGAWNARKVLLLGEDLLAATLGGREQTEEKAFENVDAELLLEAILGLPIEFRELLMLVYYEELTLKEVGQLLGLPGGTVRSRLHRARQKLRLALEEEGWLQP